MWSPGVKYNVFQQPARVAGQHFLSQALYVDIELRLRPCEKMKAGITSPSFVVTAITIMLTGCSVSITLGTCFGNRTGHH